jgi:hypothetical protein
MLGTGLLRKATKVVVYTAIPVAGPLKAASMGTRNSRLSLKEQKKQTALLQQQVNVQAATALAGHQMPWVDPNQYALPQPPPMPPPLG